MRLVEVLLFSLVLALAACSSTPPAAEPGLPMAKKASAGCVGDAEWAYSAKRGESIFSSSCAYCHKRDGSGQAGGVPALANNAGLSADPDRGIRMLLITQSPRARSHGMEYDDMVAMLGELSDKNLADALTYVLSSWGNCAGPIEADRIKEVAAKMPME